LADPRQQQFEQAILPHLDAAYNLARWLTGSAADADDAVQDACLRALTFFDGFRGGDGRAWLLTIVRNSCYDWLRKNRGATLLAAVGPEEMERAADHAPGIEADLLRRAEGKMIEEGLAALPAEYREALVLRELEGMSYREIAQVAGVPVGTVMSRLARGRRRLGEVLQRSMKESPRGMGPAVAKAEKS
jgi:RNA polymerase sigma-70 factor (ECF subfamily)